jgi:AraC family transcriptional regulator
MDSTTCLFASDKPTQSLLRGRGFVAARTANSRRCHLPLHGHDWALLLVVVSGEWQDRSDAGARSVVREGEIAFSPARSRHEVAVAAGSDVVAVELAPALTAPFCSLYGNAPGHVICPFEDFEGIPERMLLELARKDGATALLFESLLLNLMALGSRSVMHSKPRNDEFLSKIVAHVHLHLSSPLKVSELAAVACVSESRLSRRFREAMGISVGEYVRQCRIRAASRALRYSDETLREIALSTGFYDQAHFTRVFKSVKSVTPLEYRQTEAR